MFKYFEKRFKFSTVALVFFGASFTLFLYDYVYKYITSVPFRWDRFWEYFPNLFLGTIAMTVFSYFILNIFYYLFKNRKPFTSFLPVIFLCIAVIEVYNLTVDHLLPLQANIGNPLPLKKQIIGNLILAVFYLVLVLILTYITHLRDVRKAHIELKQQKLQLEVEKAQAELKFLKLQVNPHFLHNTLNSFYARSLPLSKELSEGILTLSEIMRYSLEEAYTHDGKVLLKDEIEHVGNVIKLNQFRFRNNLQIQMEVKGILNGYSIIPFVLITLAENIFKHGDLTDATSPIKILMEVGDGSFRYYSENKKKTGPKELSTGIGLDNIKKRLEIAYGDGYTLNIKEDTNFYTTELTINEL